MGKYICLLILFWGNFISFAQTGADSASSTKAPAVSITPVAPSFSSLPGGTAKATSEPIGSAVLKPVFGMGAGMLSYYGNIKPSSALQNMGTGTIGFDFTLSQKLNNYLFVNFYAMTGTLGVAVDANTSRNANFQSRITLGGINFQYNFYQFLPKKHPIEPFIITGIENFNFNSKTDLYDKNGNKYYYWTDGTIKNMQQFGGPNGTNPAIAVNLVRSYDYQTDLRQLNLSKYGYYSDNSFAIPLGIGFLFHLSERVDLKLHTTMHFTFTDYVDGLPNGKNDKFMMTGFSLHWDLLGPKRTIDTLNEHWFDTVDFQAMDTLDGDRDRVRDTCDDCPGTPAGASVDMRGCPTDIDGDGVPDYRDKELDSKAGAVVDADGVTLSDSLIQRRYEQFMDTSNQYADVITKFHGAYGKGGTSPVIPVSAGNRDNGKSPPSEYSVLLGTYKTGLPAATMAKFLSIRDIETTTNPDSSISYTVGHYAGFADAQSRKRAEVKDGLTDSKVVYKKDGKFVEAAGDLNGSIKSEKNKLKKLPNETNEQDALLVANTKGVVFRIQLGAFKSRISKAAFSSIPDLMEIRNEDGYYKYMTGTYTTYSDAAKGKAELVRKGFGDPFITAYNNGKRVKVSSEGATPANGQKEIKEDLTETSKPKNTIGSKSVVFKVQVGVFKHEPPADKKVEYKLLKEGVQEEKTSTGLTRFVVGSTNDYSEAQKIKNEMQKQGIEDSFIIAFYNGQYIPVQEALELLK